MVRALSALVLVALAAGSPHAASELPHRMGMYPQGGAGTPFVMLDSDVTVRVRGPIVEATITQTFKNDTDRVTEATYIFPLPPDAAVSAMEITTGNRTIRAAIEARDKAVARYEEAVAKGVGAALLEQERPDIFTQTVSAIPAKGEVKVTLRFDTVAYHAHGTWILALPLVVAPRYVPGTATSRPTTGTGRAPDTDRSPDASRVTPGGSPGAGGRTDMRIEFADEVADVTSPSHEIKGSGTAYTLADPKTDHDVILRWRTKVAQQGWVEASADGGGFAAVLVEAKPAPARKAAVEVRLILDRAATTRGDAEAVQRAAVRAVLGALEARDRVAVAGSDTFAAAAPDATLRSLDDAWRKTASAFDLTKVLTSLRSSDDVLVLVSDGLVADDKAALAAALKLGKPIHVIAVGPSPNRSLLAQIADQTGGTLRFAIVGDDFAALAKDVIADVTTPPEAVGITWGTLGASDVVPAKLPRLGSGQAVLVLARVKKAQAANARVRGDVFGFTPVTAAKAPAGATTARGTLARRWAKLELDELVRAGKPTKTIAEHALKYGLVSPATAMVAIGDEVIVEGGVKHSTPVPVSVPEGMQWQLVKKQTTVDTTSVDTDKVSVTRKKAGEKNNKEEEDDSDSAKGLAQEAPEPDSEPTMAPPAPSSGSSYDEDGEYDGGGRDQMREETLAFSSSSRRAVRLAFSLGAGVARAAGESAPLGAFGARVEYGRGRVLAGLDASAWLVDGVHGQGSVLGTLARRGLLDRKLEIGAGLGVRFTGDAVGPAAEVVLRIALPIRGLATYFRYDGALLRTQDTSTGQNAFTFGVEARW